jgi:hypothetical protein
MVQMWCYHRRLVEVFNKSTHVSALRHADDKTACTGRHPRH